ncbi:hypothetical protein VKT23_002389 [Stygiomarasmius scandens]|uniref:Sodium/calcium exchanger membrane region domain-containing protein n=1 Tax=Marasmiellus scandens TaxID=2682957 RepID=A0ABR1K5J2_9AGAR
MSSTEKINRRNPRPSDEERPPTHEETYSSETERPQSPHFRNSLIPTPAGMVRFKDRFLRKGKRKIGTYESIKNIVFSSWLNVFVVFIPISWVAHFLNANNPEGEGVFPFQATFVLCLLAIVPLERLFDYGGEQMAFYCGKDLGDLIVVTLNNAVEATLAIILLTKCELKLLQSTIIGVVILHLLLVPGASFITGGAQIMHQDLHPHLTELNHTLLTMGVLALLLPAAFFAALDRGDASLPTSANYIVNDATRTNFLQISRGIAIILLAVYVSSRIFLHNPPGDDNALKPDPQAPLALIHEEKHLVNDEPEVSQWVCMVMLAITIALMAATAEWLVDSIEPVRNQGKIQEEWFGLVLLPIVSFAADGILSVGNFAVYIVRHILRVERLRSSPLAKARAIDLSIQFTLFWTPFIVLLGWWTERPMSLLFDFYEVAVLLGSCFLVNYVTADAKTNWAEGYMMVSFYLMIALTSWFYGGQGEIEELLQAAKCAFAEGGAELTAE